MKGVSEKTYRKMCNICGRFFTSRRSDAQYDRPACRQTASRLHRWHEEEKQKPKSSTTEGVSHD